LLPGDRTQQKPDRYSVSGFSTFVSTAWDALVDLLAAMITAEMKNRGGESGSKKPVPSDRS
jgi:hypothetical protein